MTTNTDTLIAHSKTLTTTERFQLINTIKDRFVEANRNRDYALADRLQSLLDDIYRAN